MYTIADLEMTQRHVVEGHRRIAEQRGRIATLRADGPDITRAEDFLRNMLELLAGRERHRDEIAAELQGRASSAGAG